MRWRSTSRIPGRSVSPACCAAAAAGAQRRMRLGWYSGDRDIASDPVSFTDRIGSELSEHDCIGLDRARLERQSSGGGSSGGGSSGGGGGGGGGSGLVGAEQSFRRWVCSAVFFQLALFCQIANLNQWVCYRPKCKPCLTMSNSQRFAARALEFRAPGVALSLFPSPSQAREMERREAPGALRERLADHNAARRAPLRRRAPPSDVGGGASRRSTVATRSLAVYRPQPRDAIPAPISRSSLEDVLDEQG